MSTFAVVTFPNVEMFRRGIDELKRLHTDGSIKLYSSALVARDPSGKPSIQELTAEGLGMTAIGAMIAAGLPLGPVAAMIGTASSALIANSAEFINERDEGKLVEPFSRELAAGKAAIVVELDEDGLIALEDTMRRIGGTMIRQIAEPDQPD